MAPKRPHDDDAARPVKKHRQGFSVGPANLPDGVHKRKVQKIKRDLIHKAKLKKQYAKLKTREGIVAQKPAHEDQVQDEVHEPVPEPNLQPHPDRLKMLEEDSPEPAPPSFAQPAGQRRNRSRAQPYKKEAELGQQKKEQAEARQKAREYAEKERVKKAAERERFRKLMAKARTAGPNGQRKLGRESTFLLEKAKRLVGKT